MGGLHLSWLHLRDVLTVTAIGIEIAVGGTIIAGLQLWYARSRDKKLDTRNDWEKIHKAMMEFRFRREMLNNPPPYGKTNEAVKETALEAFSALHQLRGQLDRVRYPLAIEIENYLKDNWAAHQWRADAFTPKFDEYTRESARRCW